MILGRGIFTYTFCPYPVRLEPPRAFFRTSVEKGPISGAGLISGGGQGAGWPGAIVRMYYRRQLVRFSCDYVFVYMQLVNVSNSMSVIRSWYLSTPDSFRQ